MIDINFLQRITEPTRVTYNSSTLIDHIYTKSDSNITTDLIESDLSDHKLTVCKLKLNGMKVLQRINNKNMAYCRKLIKIFLKYENWNFKIRMNVNEAARFVQGRIKQTLHIQILLETRELGAKK